MLGDAKIELPREPKHKGKTETAPGVRLQTAEPQTASLRHSLTFAPTHSVPLHLHRHHSMQRIFWKFVAVVVLLGSVYLSVKHSSAKSPFVSTAGQEATSVPLGIKSANSRLPVSLDPSSAASDHDLFVSSFSEDQVWPSVSIGILVRNKAHSLPYFLGALESLDYPKSRIHLYIRADNCLDDSLTVLRRWVAAAAGAYHAVELLEDSKTAQLQGIPVAWTPEHYEHLIELRQAALDAARRAWADFHFSLDADVILMNKRTLRDLVEATLVPPPGGNIIVLAPMLNCTTSEVYSNFWGAMTEEGYYKRSDNYFDLQKRVSLGIHPVAMVHSALLVNLRNLVARQINYSPRPDTYQGPVDDLIIFARIAQTAGISLYLDNRQFYGYFAMPVDESDVEAMQATGNDAELIEVSAIDATSSEAHWLARDVELFTHLRLQAMLDQEDRWRVIAAPSLNATAESHLPVMSKLGFDEVYMINLIRRPDRRSQMDYALSQVGVKARHVPAVDGLELNHARVEALGIRQLPGYADPYHKRPLKFGEIGCFLSHYSLWQEMIDKGYERILILEDDVRLAPSFRRSLREVMAEADRIRPDWELIYIGRKRMSKNERQVAGSSMLAHPDYTYWTLGYALRRSGAIKLINQRPLQKIVAVDEYLPIMFDRHPNKEWLKNFEPRDLVALSAEPLLLEPTHYTGEPNYVSDTEDSKVFGI